MLNTVFRRSTRFAPALMLAACFIGSAPARAADLLDVEVVHNFAPEPRQAGGGQQPRAGVILATDGSLYGTASGGGKYGKGTLYRTKPNGSTRIIHSFSGSEGAYPQAELVLLGDALYGSAQGVDRGPNRHRQGVLFKYEAELGLTPLHTFDWDLDGGLPSGLLLASDGNFYGTLATGGKNDYGALFRMTPSGVVTIMHRFNVSGVAAPTGTLVQGVDGALYGTSEGYYPRDEPGTYRRGAIYRFSLDGQLSVIHEFSVNGTDSSQGIVPDSGLVVGRDGALYGFAMYGGSLSGGVFFKVNIDGSNYTVLTSLPGKGFSGTNPLILGRDGHFYGAEMHAEYYGPGRLIRLTADGIYTVLYTFPDENDRYMGNLPLGRLLQTPDGRLYGTTLTGGSALNGTLFRTMLPIQ